VGSHLPRCLALIGTAALAALTLAAAGAPPLAARAAAGSGLAPPPAATAPDRAVPVVEEDEERGYQLSVRGAGPYRIGRSLTALTEAGLIDAVWPGPPCSEDVVGAGATGRWAGKILLVFRRGILISIGTASGSVRSPAGAGPGTSFARAEQIYGKRGRPIRSRTGHQGYVVPAGPMVELFTDHPIRPGIGWYEVGPRGFSLHGFLADDRC